MCRSRFLARSRTFHRSQLAAYNSVPVRYRSLNKMIISVRINHQKCKENLKSPEYVGARHLCQIPVGQWMNAYETLNRLAK
jgi:hypothetical protein